MGAIGSVCCEEQNNKQRKKDKENDQQETPLPNPTSSPSALLNNKKTQNKPEPNSKPIKQNIHNNELQMTSSGNKSIPLNSANKVNTNSSNSKPSATTGISKPPILPTTNTAISSSQGPKVEDVAQVIEKMYPAPKSVKWESFEIIGKIGSGGFGEVFLAELKENKAKGINEKYAIKRVIKNEIYRKKLTANIKLQKKILQESKSKFITTLYYAFRDEHYLYFVMEWAPGGDTYTLINQASPRLNDFKKAGEEAVRFILACLILGMEYLHSKNIMYRDLKPENVLIFENGYAKLTDFGLAKQIHEDQLSRTEAGTTIYYAPEMVLKEGYQKEIDIWAIGVYAYEMSNYYPPFASADIKEKLKVKRVVKQAETKRVWKNPNLSEELKDFINSILKFDPKERLGYKGFDEMKNHPFFTKVNFNWAELEEMKMKSPLKQIIDSHKIKCKPYNPNEVNKKLMNMTNAGKSQQPECWTYARDKNE